MCKSYRREQKILTSPEIEARSEQRRGGSVMEALAADVDTDLVDVQTSSCLCHPTPVPQTTLAAKRGACQSALLPSASKDCYSE